LNMAIDDSLEARWQRAQRLSPHQVPSPCVGVCAMSSVTPDHPVCAGCYRNLDEIARWGGMTEADKNGVWQDLRAREVAQFDS
jgi:predicted Fe-S protein YdhL (DUF1289 family)